MKKIIITILVFIPVYLTAQWEIIHKNKWEYFTSLKLYDDSLGFASANNGQIIKTTDGGLSWDNHIRLEGELEELQFVDKNHWWLTSTKADTIKRLYRSTDGGDTWEELNYDISHMNFIQFVGKEKGWAEQSGKLYFTLDGGYSWIAKSANISNVCQMSFIDENIGWIFDGVLRKTIDGGNTWETFNYSEIEKIRAVSESICYFQKGIEIYWTTNGGKYWKNIHPLDFTMFRGGIGMQWDCINDTSIYIYVAGHTFHRLFEKY